MATETINIIISTSGSRVVIRDLTDIQNGASGALSAIEALQKTLKSLGSAWAINEVRKAADDYVSLQNKLKALGVAQGDLAATTQRLADISNKSYASLEATGTLYARLLPAAKALGASQNEIFTFTQAASQAMTVFGTSGGTATGALLQLSQAMSRGKVQAQEFKSLLDGMYPLLQVVANNLDAAGGSVTKLRELMLAGKLSSKEFFAAAIKGAPELENMMAHIAPTTTQALTVLRNQFVLTIGKLNEILGVTSGFAKAVVWLADRLPQITVAVISLAAAWAAYNVTAAITAVANANVVTSFFAMQALITMRVIPAIVAMNGALLANPLALLIAGLVAATSYLYIFRNEITLGIDKTTTMGDLFTAIGRVLPNMTSMFGDLGKKLSMIELPSFADFARELAKYIDTATAIFNGFGREIGALFASLPPAASDAAARMANFFISKINGMSKALTDFVNNAFAAAGSDVRIKPIFEMKEIVNLNKGALDDIGKNAGEAFVEGFNSSAKNATNFVNAAFIEAQKIGKQRLADAAKDKTNLDDKNNSDDPAVVDQKAIAAANKFATELERLRDKYDGVYKAQSALTDGKKLLDEALAKGLLGKDKEENLRTYNRLLRQMHQELDDQADPLGAINRELDEQQKVLKMTSKEQELYNQYKRISTEQLSKGTSQLQLDTSGIYAHLAAVQAETEAARVRNGILDETIGKLEQEALRRQELVGLQASNDPLKRAAAEKSYFDQNSDLLETQSQSEIRHIQERKAAIDLDLRDSVISQQRHDLMIRKLDQQTTNIRLKQASDFFGGLAVLMNSHSKKAFAIGKAAAIAQAIIQTYLGATSAFTSLAQTGPWGAIAGGVAAAAAIAAGMANVAQIRSQQMPAFAHGGSLTVGGVGGTDSQMVSFMATPGETVRVTTPQQESRTQTQGDGVVFNFNMPGMSNPSQARKTSSELQRSVAVANSSGRRFR